MRKKASKNSTQEPAALRSSSQNITQTSWDETSTPIPQKYLLKNLKASENHSPNQSTQKSPQSRDFLMESLNILKAKWAEQRIRAQFALATQVQETKKPTTQYGTSVGPKVSSPNRQSTSGLKEEKQITNQKLNTDIYTPYDTWKNEYPIRFQDHNYESLEF